MERWMMRDPLEVVSRMQEQGIRREQKIIEEHMGQQLKSVPDHIQRDLFRWGAWARRPQFWANLKAAPFFKLLGMAGGEEPRDVSLDPQSMALHRVVMALDVKFQVVLYAYYVAEVGYEDMPELFNAKGISRATYYRRLAAGSVMAHNQGKRWLENATKSL